MYRGDDPARPGTPRTPDGAPPVRTDEAAELLERSVGYALGAARSVTPALLGRGTPCAGWNLGMLMAHIDDSLAALHEGIDEGRVTLVPTAPESPESPDRPGTSDAPAPYGDARDPAAAFRRRATRLLASWTAAGPADRLIGVADCPLTAAAVALTGALEIAVHGWDITRATGQYDRPVPDALARELLGVAHQLVPHPAARPPLFAPEVPLAPGAPYGDRLIAYLGRTPN